MLAQNVAHSILHYVLMAIALLLFICCLILYPLISSLSIALHAQVSPFDGTKGAQQNSNIVGSVITTAGMRDALLKRIEIDVVRVFYTASYRGYLDIKWDLVLIEGWFPSLKDFITLSRNKFNGVKIVFYCLDPSYPGIDIISKFDFDAILTNSKTLSQHPTLYNWDVQKRIGFMMLAADVDIMTPNNSIPRDWGAVYIGAGGNMLEYKPKLYQLLVDSIPFKLRLHGSNWEHVPLLRDIWQGTLPVQDIANAYSSGEVVLASTIQAQEAFGMINNRIFEALSCGSIVILSNFCPAIYEEFGDIILYVNETHPISHHLKFIQGNKEYADNLRLKGREIILQSHSWTHRVVELIDFYEHINNLDSASSSRHSSGRVGGCCLRPHCPNVTIIISERLRFHLDVIHVVAPGLHRVFCQDFHVHEQSEQEWLSHPTSPQNETDMEIIVMVMTPFDKLDTSLRSLARPTLRDGRLQRRAGFIVGYDPNLTPPTIESNRFDHYDVLWFRDNYELDMWRSQGCVFSDFRLQHAFGAGILPVEKRPVRTGGTVFVCQFRFWKLCKIAERERFAGFKIVNETVGLLLLGGEFRDWLRFGNVLSPNEISSVVHVADGRTGKAIEMIQSADAVYIMNGVLSTPVSTTVDDVLWPYVAAAVAGSKIYLFQNNEHVLKTLSSSTSLPASEWDEENYFRGKLKEGIDRLVGFGSALSSLSLQDLTFREDDNLTFLSQNELDYLRDLNTKRKIVSVLQISVDYFQIAVEGQCCFQLSSNPPLRNPMKDSICMLRPFRYLVLVSSQMDESLNCDENEVCSTEFKYELDIHAFLRGNFYSDVIYSTDFHFSTLTNQSSYALKQAPSRQLGFKEMGLLSNTFFSFDIDTAQ